MLPGNQTWLKNLTTRSEALPTFYAMTYDQCHCTTGHHLRDHFQRISVLRAIPAMYYYLLGMAGTIFSPCAALQSKLGVSAPAVRLLMQRLHVSAVRTAHQIACLLRRLERPKHRTSPAAPITDPALHHPLDPSCGCSGSALAEPVRYATPLAFSFFLSFLPGGEPLQFYWWKATVKFWNVSLSQYGSDLSRDVLCSDVGLARERCKECWTGKMLSAV